MCLLKNIDFWCTAQFLAADDDLTLGGGVNSFQPNAIFPPVKTAIEGSNALTTKKERKKNYAVRKRVSYGAQLPQCPVPPKFGQLQPRPGGSVHRVNPPTKAARQEKTRLSITSAHGY